jgi:hypothetical protein
MDHASAESAFSMTPATAGTFSWSGDTMTFSPASPLAGGTTYTALVSTAASDTALNRLPSERSWSFDTAAGESVTSYPASATVERRSGKVRSGSVAQLAADDGAYYQVRSTRSGRSRVASWYGTFANVPAAPGNLKVSLRSKASKRTKQTISIWQWSSGTWTQLDSRRIGASETLVELAPSGGYVSSAGELRIRVRSKARAGFSTSTDLLALSYGG